ncbi:glutamate--tRNA ligase, partial [Methylobacterium trifolii]
GVPPDRAEAFWAAVRANLGKVAEAGDWWRVVSGPVAPVIADPALIAAAAETLPPEPYGPETWKAWTTMLRERTGAKGRALFMPLRLALTGLEHGPDLAGLLPLIGRARAARRLAGETA